MAQVVVEMTGEEAKLWASTQNLMRAYSGLEGQVEKVGGASRKAADENKKLGDAAKRVFEETRTPAERHIQKMEQLNSLLQKGKIDQETYGRAAKQAGDQLARAGQVGHGAFTNLGQAIKDSAFHLLGVGTAAAAALKVFEEIKGAKEDAAREAREAEMGMGALGQLTTDPKRLRELQEGAKQTYAEGGAKSLDEAARIVFRLESAGMMGERKLISQLKSTGLVSDTAGMAKSAKTLMASMGSEAGSFREVLSKGFAAGTYAPSYVEELLPAAAKAGTQAKAAGIGSSELLAATAVVTEATGEAQLGGTRVAAMMKALGRMGKGQFGDEDLPEGEAGELRAQVMKSVKGKGMAQLDFKGKNLMDRLKLIESLQLPEPVLQKLFGRQEGLQAARVLLGNEGRMRQATADIGGAARDDRVGKALGLADLDPAMAAARQARVSTAAEKVSAEEIGITTNLAEAVRREHYRKIRTGDVPEGLMSWGLRKMGLGELNVGAARAYETITGGLPGSGRATLRDAMNMGTLDDNPALKRQVEEHLGLAAEKLSNAADKLERSVRGNPTLGRPDEDK